MKREELEKQILDIIRSGRNFTKMAEEIASLIEQNKPTGEYFERIYIKSEADLPKEKGFYITGIGNATAFDPGEKKVKPFQSDSVEFWMKCIDYYLRPVEQKPDCYPKEEIADLLNDSLGSADDSIEYHNYLIRPLNHEWWIFHNGVGSGEPLKQWIKHNLK